MSRKPTAVRAGHAFEQRVAPSTAGSAAPPRRSDVGAQRREALVPPRTEVQVGQGQAVDIGIQAKEFLRTKRLMEELLAKHTGQPIDRVHLDTDRDDYMDPEEARTYGMIDGICVRRGGIVATPPSPNGTGH